MIYVHQSGFLPQHSTVTQRCYLTHEWTIALDQRQCVQAAFLDLSKAYNRVPTAGLLFNLSGCGFSRHSLKWMNSFLANRRQRVKVWIMHSEWATLSCGIPHGTVLGPTLFLVFINDLATNLVGKPSIFADDSAVFSRGNNKLETCQAWSKDLDSAQDWAVTWSMIFNADKSEWLQITSKHTAAHDHDQVTMKRQAIPWVKAHNPLGLKVTSTLSWSEHISRTRAKMRKKRVGMIRKIQSSSPEPRFEKDLHSSNSFHFGVRVCGLERRQHFNSSEATGPFLPRKSCQASTSASKIHLSDFVAILQDKKQCIAYVSATAYCLKLAVRRHTIICAVIIFWYQQWGRPLHWRPFFQDPSFCGMTCPADIKALRTVASFKAALKTHLKL